MANIARNEKTIEEVLSEVCYQMTLRYMTSPNSPKSEQLRMQMAHTAIIETVNMVGNYWAGINGPQLKDVKIEDIRVTDAEM